MFASDEDQSSQRCPHCDTVLSADDINIREGVALCPGCRKLTRLSELNFTDRSVDEILAQPPTRCSIVSDGQTLRITASTRSLAGFFGALAIGLFWNGITSVFVCLAAAGIYRNLVGPLPAWVPDPKQDGEPMGLGMSIFLLLFVTPFIVAGVAILVAGLMCLFGRVVVVVEEMGSYVATGIGFFSWKRRFDPLQVRRVSEGLSSWETNGKKDKQIELHAAGRKLKFGSQLSDDRTEWLRVVLHELFLGDPSRRTATDLPRPSWLPRRT